MNNTREYLDALKASVDLRVIFGEEKLVCPYHDDYIPSLKTYDDHGFCYACGKWVDGLDMIMDIKGLSFKQAIELMEKHRGTISDEEPVVKQIPMSLVAKWHRQLWRSDQALSYLFDRGLRENILKGLRIGWNDKIVIPHIANDKVLNLKWRWLDDSGPKYTSPKHRSFPALYPWDYFRKYFSSSPALFLCEGEFDSMILLQEGLPALSVPSGANTNLTPWAGWMRRFKYVVLLYDMDDGGERGAKALLKPNKETGETLIERMSPTSVVRYRWNPELGKDVTDARKHLVPKLLNTYMRVKGEN